MTPLRWMINCNLAGALSACWPSGSSPTTSDELARTVRWQHLQVQTTAPDDLEIDVAHPVSATAFRGTCLRHSGIASGCDRRSNARRRSVRTVCRCRSRPRDQRTGSRRWQRRVAIVATGCSGLLINLCHIEGSAAYSGPKCSVSLVDADGRSLGQSNSGFA